MIAPGTETFWISIATSLSEVCRAISSSTAFSSVFNEDQAPYAIVFAHPPDKL